MASLELALFFGLLILLIQLSLDRMQSLHSMSQKSNSLWNRRSLSAFSGGVFISYLLLDVLPSVYQVQGRLSKLVFLTFLGSISLLFLLERHIGSHRLVYRIKAEMREEHAVILFVYHILVGIAFIAFSPNFSTLLLFFIPVALFTAFSSMSLREVYEIEKESSFVKFVLSASTLIGIALATAIPVSRLLYYPLLAFVGGSVFYVVMSDVLKNADKKSIYFFWGIVLYTAIIGVFWLAF